jgi:hypothetical protein
MHELKTFKFYGKDKSVKRLKGNTPIEAFTSAGFTTTDLDNFEGFEELPQTISAGIILKGKIKSEDAEVLGDAVEFFESSLGLHPNVLSDSLEKFLRDYSSFKVVATEITDGSGQCISIVCDIAMVSVVTTYLTSVIDGQANDIGSLTDLHKFTKAEKLECDFWWDLKNCWMATIGYEAASTILGLIQSEGRAKFEPDVQVDFTKMVAFG